jgi:hypothetical protein
MRAAMLSEAALRFHARCSRRLESAGGGDEGIGRFRSRRANYTSPPLERPPIAAYVSMQRVLSATNDAKSSEPIALQTRK